MDCEKWNFVQKLSKSFVNLSNLFFVFFEVQYSYENMRKYIVRRDKER